MYLSFHHWWYYLYDFVILTYAPSPRQHSSFEHAERQSFLTLHNTHRPTQSNKTEPFWQIHRYSCFPSIHLSSFSCYSGPGYSGCRLLPQPPPLPGRAQGILIVDRQSTAPGSPPSWTCPEYLHKESVQVASWSDAETPLLAPFSMKEQQFLSKLLSTCQSSSLCPYQWSQTPWKVWQLLSEISFIQFLPRALSIRAGTLKKGQSRVLCSSSANKQTFKCLSPHIFCKKIIQLKLYY